jgi:YHS domain-containing protein
MSLAMSLAREFIGAFAIVLASGTAAHAQGTAAPIPAVALKGYDVVAYFKQSRALQGSPEFRQDWDGARYYFSSAQNRVAFDADPDHFVPQFGGYCAMGMSKGKKTDADPTVFKIIDGKLYVFSSPKAADAVGADPVALARARQAWQALK